MNKYRKKPAVIEAFQMTEHRRWHNDKWPEWLNVAWQKDRDEEGALFSIGPGNNGALAIHTLEGDYAVAWGDFIIQGVQDELYPCKSDIFKATYDPVEAE